MSNVLVNDLYLGDIADAIREKLNVQTTYKPSEMANAIESISGGGSSLGTKSITANGTYNASSDSLDGYSQVTVNVPQGVTPTGTKQISITQNGTTTEDVTNYANAEITVNVSGGSSRLPSGYTEIDSVQLTGTQYIDTGIVPVQYDNFRVEFKPTQLTATGDTLFSVGTGTYQTIVLMYTDNTFAKYFKSGSAPNINPRVEQDKYYELFLMHGAFLVASEDNIMSFVAVSYGGETDGTDKTLHIGRRANGQMPFHGNIRSFAVVNNSSGTDKLNLVPCIRDSDNKVGFYDLVSESFVGSSGGDFVAGGLH